MPVIKNKINTTAGVVPSSSDILEGEIAINAADGKVFFRDNSGIGEVGTKHIKIKNDDTSTMNFGEPIIHNGRGDFVKIQDDSVHVPLSGETTYVTPSSYVEHTVAAYDSSTGRVFIVYLNRDDNFIYLVIGRTTENNEIFTSTFSNPIVISTDTTSSNSCDVIFDSLNNKLIFSFWYLSSNKYVIGTVVDDTSIILTAPADIYPGFVYETKIVHAKEIGKYVFSGTYNGGSVQPAALVGTFTAGPTGDGSDDSIIFGTHNALNVYTFSLIYESSIDRVIICSDVGIQTAKITLGVNGDGSDDTLVVGTHATYSYGYEAEILYVPDNSKVLLMYADGYNSSHMSYVWGDITIGALNDGSDDTISLSSKTTTGYYVYDSPKLTYNYSTNTIDFIIPDSYTHVFNATVDNDVLVINNSEQTGTYSPNDYTSSIFYNPDLGYSMFIDEETLTLYTPTLYITNLTEDNFIGFASRTAEQYDWFPCYTKGSIIGNQTGLIPGRKYYVQRDGTLSLTADIPDVYAGLAISATELIVKG